MERRDVLKAIGAAAAFTLMPRTAEAAWERVHARAGAALTLSDERSTLITEVAEAIIPRTDTPGATDVGVTAFIDEIVAEYYSDDERTTFNAGLDAILARVQASGASSFGGMNADARKQLMDSLDVPRDRQAADARAYSRLKGLVVHGYFTSERVQKDVLKTVIMPGKFDGNAPMKAVGSNG